AGIDPSAIKALARNAKSFSDLADEYLVQHAKPNKKSWTQDEWIIEERLKPRWKGVAASAVSRHDVRSLVESIKDRAPVLANRTLALIRTIFGFAVERDWRTDNPAIGVRPPAKEQRRDRVLTTAELKTMWDALETEEPLIRTLFRLRILTGQRGG